MTNMLSQIMTDRRTPLRYPDIRKAQLLKHLFLKRHSPRPLNSSIPTLHINANKIREAASMQAAAKLRLKNMRDHEASFGYPQEDLEAMIKVRKSAALKPVSMLNSINGRYVRSLVKVSKTTQTEDPKPRYQRGFQIHRNRIRLRNGRLQGLHRTIDFTPAPVTITVRKISPEKDAHFFFPRFDGGYDHGSRNMKNCSMDFEEYNGFKLPRLPMKSKQLNKKVLIKIDLKNDNISKWESNSETTSSLLL